MLVLCRCTCECQWVSECVSFSFWFESLLLYSFMLHFLLLFTFYFSSCSFSSSSSRYLYFTLIPHSIEPWIKTLMYKISIVQLISCLCVALLCFVYVRKYARMLRPIAWQLKKYVIYFCWCRSLRFDNLEYQCATRLYTHVKHNYMQRQLFLLILVSFRKIENKMKLSIQTIDLVFLSSISIASVDERYWLKAAWNNFCAFFCFQSAPSI